MRNTAALLLAAGLSRRMGQQKLLLPLGDRTVIARCIGSVLQAGIGNVVVVTGPEGGAVRDAVKGFPVTVVTNAACGTEMADSVKTGLDALDASGGGEDDVFVCPGDHPLVLPSTFTAMHAAYRNDPGIIIPRYLGKKGHPVLFPRQILAEIGTVPALRDILRKHPDAVRPIDIYDEGVVIDVDTPEDYREARMHFFAAEHAAARHENRPNGAAAVAGGSATGAAR